MNSPVRSVLAVALGLAALISGVGAQTQTGDRRQFTTSTTLGQEASALTKLLDELHYNHDAVKSADYANVVPDFMSELDGQRLFFLGSDRTKFAAAYGRNIYYNVSFLSNIDAAYEIFYVYQQRVEARVAWIFEKLGQDFDFSAADTYRRDRKKADWPADATASDELWMRRLKFELVEEILNKKTTDEAKTVVRKRYERMLKNLGEIEGNDLAELFLTTIAKLYDPHSSYFSAATYEDFGIQMKLKLVGIGAVLGLDEDTCIVREIVPGGPADLERQLKPNDKIIAVAEKGQEPVEVVGMKLRKIVEKIRGRKGSEVHLTVQPADAADSSVRKQIVIVRDTVKLNSARARAGVFELPGATPDAPTQKLGVITLPTFYNEAEEGDTDSDRSSAHGDVAKLIELLKAQGVQGITLDLRRNGGGFLKEAIDLAGLFISKGPVVQVKNFSGEIHVDGDKDSKIAYSGPLAVLTDRFSASASEIVAGALQNYGRAIVIGDSSTHGKGTVQQVVEMRQINRSFAFSPQKTGAVKFTIQKYYLPSGASTQLKGVVPDITLPSIEDYLEIGEADLPRALIWDSIATSKFDGAPLDSKIVAPLKAASLARQEKLDEFAYLRKNVEWFKARQEQKTVSLNLDDRQRQKAADDAFRKEMKAEKERIAQGDYPFKTFYLGAPPAKKIKAAKKDSDEDEDDDDENETYLKADVHLREALRVLSDAIELGRNRERWVSNHAPLTARSGG
ncbi:MAG: carboxy terminal-processing peptidase [Opitutaceae bacterium]|nr:carboxy terminal-processing peptidase [Opitutaceae bacterium]